MNHRTSRPLAVLLTAWTQGHGAHVAEDCRLIQDVVTWFKAQPSME